MAKKKAPVAVVEKSPEVKKVAKRAGVTKAKNAVKNASPVVKNVRGRPKKLVAVEVEKTKKATTKATKVVEEPKKPAAQKSPAKVKKAASKTATKASKETSPKAVKQPKPKTSPAKSKKAPAVPKVAAPEKKTTARVKKAGRAQEDRTEAMDHVEEESPNEEPQKQESQEEPVETRKRTKPAKEPVAAKKPKVEVTVRIPFRHQRGIGMALTMGQGEVGQLGLGDGVYEKSRPALVDKVKDLVDVYAGGMHTVCLTANGEVYTFGCNDEGALGRDTSREGSEFEPGPVSLPAKCVQISAGDSHTAALLEDGRVYVWGTFRDSHGTMGLNASGSQKLPVPILEGVLMQKIASGSDHLVCLTQDGLVYTCGCAEQGQLGRVAEVFSNRGGRKGKNYLLTPQLVALGRGKRKILVDDIWTGSYCTFVRAKDTGAIYVFGLNNYNQLGLASQGTRFVPEISEGFKDHKWHSISGGQHHTLALDEEGKVYCIGRKEYGRLGLGDDCTDVAVPTLIPALKDQKCVEVAAGEAVSFAVTESGVAYSWGMGTNGQLGLGSEDDVTVPAVIKGKQLENRQVLSASGGGQHAVLLVKDKTPEPAGPPASAN